MQHAARPGAQGDTAPGSAPLRADRAWIALVPLLAAGWPVFAWLGRRFADGHELIPSALAVALAAGLVLRAPAAPRAARGAFTWIVATLAVAAYALALLWMPPLVQAACWSIALAATLRGVRLPTRDSGWLAVLLLLALPAVPSLQFFLGYPLRRLVTEATAALLRFEGLGVQASGAVLELGTQRIVVDAPCSGVQMLWTSLLLAAFCGGWHRLPFPSGALLLAVAAFAALVANVLRAAALFHWETRPPTWSLSESTHTGIGLVVFAGAALAIVALAKRLDARAGTEGAPEPRTPARSGDSSVAGTRSRSDAKVRPFLIACVVAGVIPLLPRRATTFAQEPPFPGWPAAYDGPTWRELELDPREQRFFGGFPGRTTRRTDGQRTVLLRWVLEPTRRLHPAQECYRGLGFELHGLPLQVEAGTTWSSFVATRGTTRWLVRERIFDEQGGEWTDVSAWFWSALVGRSRGPWFAVTLAEPPHAP